MAFFERQLQIINQALANLNGREIIISGDFNLDDSKRYATDYRNKHYFEKMKKLNVEYIFSIKKITDSHLINEIIVKTLNHSDSIFIYQISNKFLSLNNESL